MAKKQTVSLAKLENASPTFHKLCELVAAGKPVLLTENETENMLTIARAVLVVLAGAISRPDAKIANVAQIQVALADVEKKVENLKGFARQKLLEIAPQLPEHGEKGTRRGVVEGWELELRRTGGGWDDAAIKQLLESKGLKVEDYMRVSLVYKTDEGALTPEYDGGALTREEVDACRKPSSYALQKPKKMTGNLERTYNTNTEEEDNGEG